MNGHVMPLDGTEMKGVSCLYEMAVDRNSRRREAPLAPAPGHQGARPCG